MKTITLLMTGLLGLWGPSVLADALNVDPSGNVGIGIADPQFKFHAVVNDPGFPSGMMLENENSSSDFVGFRLKTALGEIHFNNSQQEFRINIVDGDTRELNLNATGDLDIAGSYGQLSSRTVKTDIHELDGHLVLDKLVQLEVKEWRYKKEAGERHVGPMAEDFYAAFGLGPDSKHVSPGDMAGVSLAAAKALHKKVEDQRETIEEQRGQLEQLRTKVEELEELRRQVAHIEAQPSDRVAVAE